jgi:hypothetical protein
MQIKSRLSSPIDVKMFLDHPAIIHKFSGDLVIFNYSKDCQYDRLWDDYSLQSRGLIVDRHTGEIYALPFPKFFNLNEMPETSLENLPNEPFTATVKMDGVLGISYIYNGDYKIATRGSFESPWAIWATEWMNDSRNMNRFGMNPRYTYLFEIISPQSQIVVDYKGKEALVLIGVIDRITGRELPYNELVYEATSIGVEYVESVEFNNIEEMVKKSKEIPKDHEGWVVTFRNGLKLKIKGEEYKKIFKFLTYASPIAFWESWEYGHLLHNKNADPADVGIKKEWLTQFAEEFRTDTDKLAKAVDQAHWKLFREIEKVVQEIEKEIFRENPNDDGRLFAAKARERRDLPKHIRRVLMYMKNKNWWKVWGLIHQAVRPKDNNLPGFEYDGLLKKFKSFGDINKA